MKLKILAKNTFDDTILVFMPRTVLRHLVGDFTTERQVWDRERVLRDVIVEADNNHLMVQSLKVAAHPRIHLTIV